MQHRELRVQYSSIECSSEPAPLDPVATAVLEHQWRTPQTAIRSAAEVLCDCQDLTASERNLLLDALLAEAMRLHADLEGILRRGLVLVERTEATGP